MEFHVIAKDWKEEWEENERCLHLIDWCESQGLTHLTQVAGDPWGMDMEFLVLSQQPIEEGEAQDLVRIGYFDIPHYENNEFHDVTVLEEIIEEHQRDGQEVLVLRTVQNRIYKWIAPAALLH